MGNIPMNLGWSSDGMLNDRQYMAMTDNRMRAIYPAPYFDPIAMQIITDPKILMLWSRFFFEWHPDVNAAINKMVVYPITDFIFDTEDEALKDNYQKAFAALDVRGKLVRAGLDYFVSGSMFASILKPFQRFCACEGCGVNEKVDFAHLKSTMRGLIHKCSKCGRVQTVNFVDMDDKDIERMRIVLWDPTDIDIEHDPIMETNEFYYTLPASIKKGLMDGDKRYLRDYPMEFMQAAKEGKPLRIYPERMLFMKRPTHSASFYKGWGQPLVTPSLKFLFHLLILLKSQDMIAIDQILPWTVLSPAQNGGTDPVDEADLGGWLSQVMDQYMKWKNNPLHKSVMPIPINAQVIGANAKSLSIYPEMQEVTSHILAGMGVPTEFVFGGLSWTGASVSLRMLENQFINYRTMMQRFLDWVVDEIGNYYGYAKINVRMQAFKMADDIAQKELTLKLKDAGLISGRTLLSELMPNIDWTKEQETIKEEALRQIAMEGELQEAKMKAMPVMPEMAPGAEGQGQESAGGGGHGDLPEGGPPRAQGANQQI